MHTIQYTVPHFCKLACVTTVSLWLNFYSDSQTLMFGGNTYAQYTLLPEGVGQTRLQRRQGNRGPLRSTFGEELSLRFRTENENGLLFHMSSFGSNGDSVSVQVRFFQHFS